MAAKRNGCMALLEGRAKGVQAATCEALGLVCRLSG
jgi:hypothetical protein